MNGARLRTVFRTDLAFHLGRPLFWVLVVLLGLTSLMLQEGDITISSGDTSIGGDMQAWITSEFSVAMVMPLVVFLLYTFFVAIAAGTTVTRDDELGVGPLIHATRLSAAEYIIGKYLAVLVAFLGVLALHVLFQMVFNHLWPNPDAERIRGPFMLVNYLRPTLILGLPMLVFFSAVSFAIGERTRKPILGFVAPLAFFLATVFFLWSWSPSWLDPRINRLLMWIDIAGFRWLQETWLEVDRGVAFYNTQPVHYDLPFLLSRLAYVAIALLALRGSVRHFARGLRGAPRRRLAVVTSPVTVAGPGGTTGALAATHAALDQRPLADLGMRMRPPAFIRTVARVARFEADLLRSHAGLYLFAPIILLQVIGSTFFQVGAFDTPLLLTPGLAAVGSMNTLTLLVTLLVLFYTVESVLREQHCGLASIYLATPARTPALLLGKAIANGVVGVVILLAALAGALIVLLVQGRVALDLRPFALVWGLLLVPTFVIWASYVTLVLAVTGSRYATYAIGLATLVLTGWKQMRGEMNWVGNWDLWSAVTWTDFDTVDPNGSALLMNRLVWLAVMVLMVALTVRVFPRREHDPARVLDRLRPAALARTGLRLAPCVLPALVLGTVLYNQVSQGFQGSVAEKRDHEYWGRNLATWGDADTPEIAAAEIDLELDPTARWFRVRGHYDLFNPFEQPMHRIPMSVGNHFEDMHWTLGGQPFEPADHARLMVFELPRPLASGDTVQIGFAHEGHLPNGITKNGGGLGEFILESGVVLTSFSTSFVPLPHFESDRGVDEDNETDPRDYEEGFWKGVTPPALGSGVRFPVRMRVSGPDDYIYNGVGVLVEEEVADGRRTVVWQTDHPVNFFNVVAGRWAVHEGDGVAIYHHPAHDYNVEEMRIALEAARRDYSEWFWPYPWAELKLSEFPGLASYAQGFPTNITFSESIGFLTRSDARNMAAFVIAAHESAHQWWGNLLMPGEGPGGNVLAEGMAHYSAALLTHAVHGEQGRIEFLKRIEANYGDERRVDSERPLVWTDGSRGGDVTVTYDKGGWVFWMLHDLMGEGACFAGLHDLIGRYMTGRDFPLLQDFVAVMREHAPDVAAYDAFVDQWFFDVVVPEYRIVAFEKQALETAGADLPPRWRVTATVRNAGTGRMPVEVAAVRGQRFDGDTAAPAAAAGPVDAAAGPVDAAAGPVDAATGPVDAAAGPVDEATGPVDAATGSVDVATGSMDAAGGSVDAATGTAETGSGTAAAPERAGDAWRIARQTVTLAAGEEAAVDIECDFEPQRLVIDPDLRVLMLHRDRAARGL
ncbi:MAG: M1 family aminopeptidase [Candidatus Eiseniibacteriota bacterium]